MIRVKQKELLPIGTRVTHYDGGPNTHGEGTIIAYNGVEPSSYLKSNFNDAVEIAGATGLLSGIIGMGYSKDIFPYVVRWDVRTSDTKWATEYPKGYKDVYGPESIRLSTIPSNIFPSNNDVLIMARYGICSIAWSPWRPMDEASYQLVKDDKNYEFCIRSRPENSALSMIPLWLNATSKEYDPKGYWPPLDEEVQFQLRGESEIRIGVTARIVFKHLNDGFTEELAPVFIVRGKGIPTRIYTLEEVQAWQGVKTSYSIKD